MKKFIMILLALTMVVAMVACGNNNTDPTEPTKPSIIEPTEPSTPSQGDDTTEPTTPSQGGDVTEPVDPTEPTDPAESTEPTERPKPEIQVVTIEEYMNQKYGEYEFVRSEPWFEMYRVYGVSVFVYQHEELRYGANLEKVYDYMFTYNWADNGYYKMNADKIEEYYDKLMKPYLKDVGEYALFSWLEQAVMPSELSYKTPYADALKEHGEFLFPELFILVKNPLTEEQKAAIVDKLTADGVKVHLHIGVAPVEDFELSRNDIIPFGPEKYSNQMDVRINWNGDMPTEEVPQVDGN